MEPEEVKYRVCFASQILVPEEVKAGKKLILVILFYGTGGGEVPACVE